MTFLLFSRDLIQEVLLRFGPLDTFQKRGGGEVNPTLRGKGVP